MPVRSSNGAPKKTGSRRKNREKGMPSKKSSLRTNSGLLNRAAEFIYDRMFKDGREQRTIRDLREISFGQKNCVRDYYVRKISNLLLVLLLCAGASAAVIVNEHMRDRTVENGQLARPDYGEGASDQSLNLTVSGQEQSENVEIHIDARQYTSSQARQLLKKAEQELTEKLPGENISLDEVRSALNFPSTLQNGAVSAEYYTRPMGMIDDDGSIIGEPDDDGTLITITADLECQDQQRTFECAVMVYPGLLTPDEQLEKKISQAVESAQADNPSSTDIQLPQSVDGHSLHWSYPKDSMVSMILILLMLLPAAMWLHEDSKVQDTAKKRRTQLELDYSQLLWKMTMLLSAGLTIRGTFTKIALQYEAGRAGMTGSSENSDGVKTRRMGPTRKSQSFQKKGSSAAKKRYVYEEMIMTLREMSSGVPEAAAYENFGRRCGLPSYIKLGSLLSQNLKKGSKGLTALLEHEAVLSLEQHRMAAKKLGEKAGIRMLLPMIMMFGVVLVVLMVPALLSM